MLRGFSRGSAVLLVVLLTALSWPATARAQDIVDARRVEFTPSVDNDVLSGSTPLVTSYSLDVFVAGGTTPVETVNLGKPAPDVDGMIRVDFVALLTTPLTPGVVYETALSSVGPGGVSVPAARSNTFSFSQPCSASISPQSQSISAAGGSGSAAVTVAAGCDWTATSNASWIALTAGAAGTGPGNVNFSVPAYSGTSNRVGTLTIAGSTFTLTQTGTPCSFAISPASQSFAAAGGTGAVTMTTTLGCSWSASSPAAWVVITSGASGTGSSTTQFSVAANTGSARSAVLTVAGKAFTVSQAAAAPTCSFAISPASQSFATAGGTGAVTVTTTAGCNWSASSNASWVAITSGASGTTSGTDRILGRGQYRSRALRGAHRCREVIHRESSGGGGDVHLHGDAVVDHGPVDSRDGHDHRDDAGRMRVDGDDAVGWIAVSGSGPGSGTISYTVNANRSGSARTATITVAGVSVTVTQRRKR